MRESRDVQNRPFFKRHAQPIERCMCGPQYDALAVAMKAKKPSDSFLRARNANPHRADGFVRTTARGPSDSSDAQAVRGTALLPDSVGHLERSLAADRPVTLEGLATHAQEMNFCFVRIGYGRAHEIR